MKSTLHIPPPPTPTPPAQISLMSSIILNLNQLVFFIGTFARQFYFSGSANGPAQNIPKCTPNVDRNTEITRCKHGKSGCFPVISSFDFVISSNTESLIMPLMVALSDCDCLDHVMWINH